jgi:lambda repressor-like predicted transcriptional regulator
MDNRAGQMFLARYHPEDVKAAIRKRYRTLGAFERAEKLAPKAVTEVLRGRTSARTSAAIERLLREQEEASQSTEVASSAPEHATHCLNAGAR